MLNIASRYSLPPASDLPLPIVFDWAWDKIRRGVTAGIPQWYKDQLLARQFESAPAGAGIGPSPTSTAVDRLSEPDLEKEIAE